MKNVKTIKKTALSVALGLALGIIGANADENENHAHHTHGAINSGDSIKEHFDKNYSYNAQVGAQYTQGYYDSSDGAYNAKNNFQSIYAYLGFEGIEFERLRFGLSLMGSVNLGNTARIYGNDIGANAILYQGFLGYTSEYFDLSAGREAIDLEWVADYVEGARFSVKIPQGATAINAYYFNRQGVADFNEIVQFEDLKRGHTIIAGLTNNSWQPLALEAYFINLNSATKDEEGGLKSYLGAWVGANLNLGNELFASSTNLKYAFLHATGKDTGLLDTHFLEVSEGLDFAIADEHQINAILGVMKVFNKKSNTGEALKLNELGDRRIIDKGSDYLYLTNALTIYAGLGYSFADYLEVGLTYANTSGINGNINGGADKLKPIHGIELSATGKYAGAELGIAYTKLLGDSKFDSAVDSKRMKLNQDYFEAFVAYNF